MLIESIIPTGSSAVDFMLLDFIGFFFSFFFFLSLNKQIPIKVTLNLWCIWLVALAIGAAESIRWRMRGRRIIDARCDGRQWRCFPSEVQIAQMTAEWGLKEWTLADAQCSKRMRSVRHWNVKQTKSLIYCNWFSIEIYSTRRDQRCIQRTDWHSTPVAPIEFLMLSQKSRE